MKLRQLSARIPLLEHAPDADAVIEVFHRWIRARARGDSFCRDQLWIDVVDYRHVADGPGVLLITHQGHYALGSAGLSWNSRRDEAGPAEAKIVSAAERVATFAARLSREPTLTVRFDPSRIAISVGDRLLAPAAEVLADLVVSALGNSNGSWGEHAALAIPDRGDVRGPPTAVAQLS